MVLHDRLSVAVKDWREQGYTADYPIGEILRFARINKDTLRFLRAPQLEALETYWYLRLKMNTPRLTALYEALYPDKVEQLDALGVSITNKEVGKALARGEDPIAKILTDDTYARALSADVLRESLSLSYASYIFALTMGAGKTALIGSIAATEFALALEYPEGPFMKNALVFAPGKTILESLRQISTIPFEKLLPPRLLPAFLANVKLIYTVDGDPDIQVVEKSTYNLIVTNAEKITLRKMSRRADQSELDYEAKEEREKLYANRRLQKIASLPALGIFSDEAHHTYGNALGEELGRARQTINHIAGETDLVCVVNTTGTPYYERQFLRDVVYWYGLAEGIRSNILKSIEDRIIAYDFSDQSEDEVIADVLSDFFKQYGQVSLPEGQKAKIAFYFKTQEHLNESKRVIEENLTKLNLPTGIVLTNTQKSSAEEVEEFRRLNDPESQKRIVLLVGRGTEGWDCPSLFATALVRELSSSNTYVLQAATRCLRQVPGNTHRASIYLESANRRILEKELEENFGIGIDELQRTPSDFEEKKLSIQKKEYPRLVITERVRTVIKKEQSEKDPEKRISKLVKPTRTKMSVVYRTAFSPVLTHSSQAMLPTGKTQIITTEEDSYGVFDAAEYLARLYRLPYTSVVIRLKTLYPRGEIPRTHLQPLCEQLDALGAEYEVKEEEVTRALAILRFVDEKGEDVFAADENGVLYHTIRFRKGETPLLLAKEDVAKNPRNYGFHFNPYNFDSAPEKEFMETMLSKLTALVRDDIEDIYFTGGLTDRKYTDFHFEYKGTDGVYHSYYPDFVIVKKDGSFFIVEMKRTGGENDIDTTEKRKAVERLENMPGNRFKYQVIYTDSPIPQSKYHELDEWI